MEEFNDNIDAPIGITSPQDCTNGKDEIDVGTEGNQMKINDKT